MRYLPLTAQQFEDLVNELLVPLNELSAPSIFTPDYAGQIVMSSIHAMDHKDGRYDISDLFEACVNRISCHITFYINDEIQKKVKAAAAPVPEVAVTVDGENEQPIVEPIASDPAG